MEVSGPAGELDVDEWAARTAAPSEGRAAEVAGWFWAYVRGLGSDADRRRVLRWATGRDALPAHEGGEAMMKLVVTAPAGALPYIKAACFHTLTLPLVESPVALAAAVGRALEEWGAAPYKDA